MMRVLPIHPQLSIVASCISQIVTGFCLFGQILCQHLFIVIDSAIVLACALQFFETIPATSDPVTSAWDQNAHFRLLG